MRRNIILGHLFTISVIVIWGLTFISSKILLRDFTPVEILFDRFLLATAAMAVLAPRALKFVSWKVELYAAIVGFSGITLYFIFENNALIYSNSSNVSLIVSTAPLFVGLINWLLLKDNKPDLNFFLGFLVAMTGIAFLSYGTLSINLNPIGDILAIGSAAVWGIYSLFVVKLLRMEISSFTITLKSFFYSVLLTLPLMVDSYSIKPDCLLKPINIINFVFLAIIASSLSFFLWSKSVEYIGSINTNLYLYGIPVVTTVGAIFILDEQITVYTIIGMVMAIGGLVISQFHLKKIKKQESKI
ncbi:MAG: DMT family transporter [Succinivibrio sp.]|nr:DMT family transporter [Succinivibrio sp.]